MKEKIHIHNIFRAPDPEDMTRSVTEKIEKLISVNVKKSNRLIEEQYQDKPKTLKEMV